MIDRASASRWIDAVIAVLLFVVALVILVATNDMGFVRDEAFYFRHSEGYQNWFVDVEAGGERAEKALGREATLKTWRHNSEHPPLNKILFGYSWRELGRKLRPIKNIRWREPAEKGGEREAIADVRGLGPAHGFQPGAQVQLLAPQVIGEPSDIRGRELAVGEVLTRSRSSATLRLLGEAIPERLKATCQPAGPGGDGVIRRTGCEGVEIRSLYVLGESAAMRLPGALFAALLVMAIYLAARGMFAGRGGAAWRLERPFALLAACGYLLLPRPFYHAHLCTFDTTIVALLFITTVAYHRSLRSSAWVWVTAVLWGFSLLAKHNALVLPVALIAHWLWDGLAEGRIRAPWPGWLALGVAGLVGAAAALWLHPLIGIGLALLIVARPGAGLQLPPVPRSYFAMLPIGLCMLVAGWPLLWHDTAANFLNWIDFHVGHEHYMQEYFGRVLAYPPFPMEMPWVLTGLTWTLPLLAACALGVVMLLGGSVRLWSGRLRSWRDGVAVTDGWQRDDDRARARSLQRLIVLGALWPIALISLPSTPVFGGTKHWFLAYPFMLLIAGYGAQSVWALACQRLRVASALAPRLLASCGAWLIVLLIALPSARATREVHPHGTAYYNELIGGLPGAAAVGLQRQFWGGATRAGLATVNKRAAKGARVWFHKCAWTAFVMYQREGWFRRDLSYSGKPPGSSLGFYHHQKDHDDYELECLADYAVRAPIMQLSIEGVPMLSVYERPR